MKKVFKILLLLFLVGIFAGAIVTVCINHKKQKELEKKEKKRPTQISYKITRKNNKYIVSNNEGKLLNKSITNIFYDGTVVYVKLSDETNATLLKYDVKKEKTSLVYEENTEIFDDIKIFGENYIINGNVYDKDFNKIKEGITESDKYFPDLKNKIVIYEDRIVKVNLDTNEEQEIAKNDDKKSYEFLEISNNGELVLLKEKSEDKTKLAYYNSGKIKELNIDVLPNRTYKLINDKYLLETEEKEEILYKIYNIEKDELVLKEKANDKYLFDDTKYLYKNNKNIILKDYVTQEEKTIENIDREVEFFKSTKDNYSLLIKYKNSDNIFYIYYL